MIQELRERWMAPETSWGTSLKNWGGKTLVLLGAIAELNEYLKLFPEVNIPHWIHVIIIAAGVLNFLVGKLSKLSDKEVINKIQDGQNEDSIHFHDSSTGLGSSDRQ